MDYSLLLAIEHLPSRKQSVESNRRRNTQAGRIEADFENDIEGLRIPTFNNDIEIEIRKSLLPTSNPLKKS